MTGMRLNSLSAYRLCKIGVEGFDDIAVLYNKKGELPLHMITARRQSRKRGEMRIFSKQMDKNTWFCFVEISYFFIADLFVN